jgi:hypothetical protein
MKRMTRVDRLAAAVVLAWLGMGPATASALDLLPVQDAVVESSGLNPNNLPKGLTEVLVIKLDGANNERKVYMEFDLSSVSKPVQNVNLRVTSAQNNGTILNSSFDLYACPDGGICETWNEADIVWDTAPDSILIGGYPNTFEYPRQPFDTADPKLGSFSIVNPVVLGDFWTYLSNQALVDAVNNDTNNTLTLMMAAGETNFPDGYGPLFASKDHATLSGPLLRIDTVLTEVPWKIDRSGDWNEGSNWLENIPAGLGSALFVDTSSTQTVYTNTDVTVNDVQFKNSSSFVLAGGGTINLTAGTAPWLPTSGVSVNQGSHQFQAAVNINNDATVDTESGSTVTFNNTLNLMGNTLTKTGAGTMSIRNDLVLGGGTVDIQQGTLAGSGTVGGHLNNTAGSVAPGNSPGILTVDGDYTQGAAGTLAIEIGGTVPGEEHDKLVITGAATLNGTLDVTMINGFSPSGNDVFDILDFDSVSGDFSNLMTAGLDWDVNTGRLCFGTCGTGGEFTDFDNDGMWNLPDLNLVLFNWQEDEASLPGEWINQRPATVGLTSLNLVLFNWQQDSTASIATVPEPTTAFCAGIGLLAVICLNRLRRI